jgi:SAM-dependent methyltransferase/predicted GNAT family N-acyltransferase
LRYVEAKDEILALRRAVFVEEQGFPPEFIVNDNDEQGVHLAAYDRGRMVALLSVHIHRPGAPTLVANGLADVDGLSVQLTKRLELASYRGSGITEVLGANVLRYAFETLRPRRIFLVLDGMHRKLRDHYNKVFMARELGEVGSGPAARLVLGLEDEPSLRTLYLRMRAMAESVHRRCPVRVPSLVRFLLADGRADLLAAEHLTRENHYVAPLSLADELPRLAAQNRLLYAEQRGRLAVTPFPPAPARLLDVGTGTGVYLALMLKEPALAGYEARGIEPSPQMLAYARFAYPEQDLVQAGAYATGEADESVDVVTANFVFIHLRNPDLALSEAWRVLKPGGLLYVVDVNDTTFTGPEAVKKMVEAHHLWHEGDRRILDSLPRRAAEFGFEPVARHATTVRNTGGSEPAFGPDELRMGRMSWWGMLAFMGQREEIEAEFQAAQEYYLGSECEVGLAVETQVYRKPRGAPTFAGS